MVGELRLAQWVEFKPRISPLRWTRPRPSMVLSSPLAHAILHDARGAFHTKQRFIQTRTTGTSRNKQETPEFFATPYAGRFGWFLMDLKPNMANFFNTVGHFFFAEKNLRIHEKKFWL